MRTNRIFQSIKTVTIFTDVFPKRKVHGKQPNVWNGTIGIHRLSLFGTSLTLNGAKGARVFRIDRERKKQKPATHCELALLSQCFPPVKSERERGRSRLRCVSDPRSQRRSTLRDLHPPSAASRLRACVWRRNGRRLFWNRRLTNTPEIRQYPSRNGIEIVNHVGLKTPSAAIWPPIGLVRTHPARPPTVRQKWSSRGTSSARKRSTSRRTATTAPTCSGDSSDKVLFVKVGYKPYLPFPESSTPWAWNCKCTGVSSSTYVSQTLNGLSSVLVPFLQFVGPC